MTMIRPSLDVAYGICRGLPIDTCLILYKENHVFSEAAFWISVSQE